MYDSVEPKYAGMTVMRFVARNIQANFQFVRNQCNHKNIYVNEKEISVVDSQHELKEGDHVQYRVY